MCNIVLLVAFAFPMCQVVTPFFSLVAPLVVTVNVMLIVLKAVVVPTTVAPPRAALVLETPSESNAAIAKVDVKVFIVFMQLFPFYRLFRLRPVFLFGVSSKKPERSL
jgi:hypothetical protein